jgi:hypothetical protein
LCQAVAVYRVDAGISDGTIVRGQRAGAVLVVKLVIVVVVDIDIDIVIDLVPMIVGWRMVSIGWMVARICRTVWRRIVGMATVVHAMVAPCRIRIIVVVIVDSGAN